MDLGVARTNVKDHLSQAGTVRGKPSYMAPEQVVGGTLARTDVFALGTVMYEMAGSQTFWAWRANEVNESST